MQRYLITCILANTIANILYFLEIGFTIGNYSVFFVGAAKF